MNASADSMHLTSRTATELAAAIAAGDVSARQVTDAHLARIDAVDEGIHAFLHVDYDGARAQADAVDAKRAAGDTLGPLAGVPVALKDHIAVKDLPWPRRGSCSRAAARPRPPRTARRSPAA